MANRTSKLLSLTFFIALSIIIIGSIVKVYTTHRDNLYSVVEKKITETARDCFIDKICEGDETTLGFLMRNGYLAKQINPITKEDINEDLIITWDGTTCTVNIRN